MKNYFCNYHGTTHFQDLIKNLIAFAVCRKRSSDRQAAHR